MGLEGCGEVGRGGGAGHRCIIWVVEIIPGFFVKKEEGIGISGTSAGGEEGGRVRMNVCR